jgi:ferredoxin
MSMFDSPFEYCTVCGQYVLLDQTQAQCAREHGCARACPLQQFFTGMEFAQPLAERPELSCVPIRHTRP